MFTCRTIIVTTIHSLRAYCVDFQMPFYAVRRGKCPGIYKTWAECKSQVDEYVGARYKKFETQVEAKNFINGFDSPASKGFNLQKGCNDTSTPRKYSSKFSSWSAEIGTSSNQHGTQTSAKLEVIDKEIEVLKEQLKMKEAEKNVLLAQLELEQLKGQCDAPGKSTPNKTASRTAKPYDKSPTTASSSNWKQNRVTQMIDFDEARQIHTSASIGSDSSSGTPGPIIYTDGACVNNGKAQARAGIGVYWGPDHPLNVSERLPGRQTNNRAEIFAVVKAVQQAKWKGFSDVTIKTDSQFLINSITKWVPGWKKKGWKTATGKPVINKEDFETLLEEAEGVTINWVHVRGHQGIEGNEAADKLAVEGANKLDI